MKNRKQRIELIIELIKNHPIGSQEELARKLNELDCRVTQATLSRDLKLLKITKVPNDRGAYVYVLPTAADLNIIPQISSAPHAPLSVTISGNIAVIKTRNGYAAGVAYDIDSCRIPEILGTIPGADTVVAILREGVGAARAREVLSPFMPPGAHFHSS